jgi:hypothetical protein
LLKRLIDWKLTTAVFGGVIVWLLCEEKERPAPDTESDVSTPLRN